MDTTYRYEISQYGRIREGVFHQECIAAFCDKDKFRKETVIFTRVSAPIYDIECEHCHSDKTPTQEEQSK